MLTDTFASRNLLNHKNTLVILYFNFTVKQKMADNLSRPLGYNGYTTTTHYVARKRKIYALLTRHIDDGYSKSNHQIYFFVVPIMLVH